MGVLTNSSLAAVVPTHDIEAARAFYVGTLGLTLDEGRSSEGALVLGVANGPGLVVYLKGMSKADHTAVGFVVDDVEATVAELKSKGVVFEDYDIPEMGIKTVDGIAEMDGNKTAWFKDPSGNILTVGNM